MTNILLIVVLSGNLKVYTYGRIAHSISFPHITHYNFVTFFVSRYSLKMQNLAQVQNWRLAPPIRQDAHADRVKRPAVEKLINVYDVGFFHQLHIASCCAYKIQSFKLHRVIFLKTTQQSKYTY